MQCTSAESEVENVKRYLRRDLLEIHGVPEFRDENTDTIVQNVVHDQLVAPELNLTQTDISISHRLPAAEGNIKPIIAKFTRRNTRDAIYQKKRNLSSKSSLDLGFLQENRLYINESLTAQCGAILAEVKKFKRRYHFKYVWTKQGKILLKKDENRSSEVHAFTSMKEFDDFNAIYTRQHSV